MLRFWERTCRMSFLVWVATISYSGLPGEVASGDPIALSVSFAGDKQHYASNSAYLRGVFYKLPNSTSYFGFTQSNTGSWTSSGSDPSMLYGFTTDSEGSWSGQLMVRADFEAGAYTGPGDYGFKVGRYTGGGSATWFGGNTVRLTYIPPTAPPTTTPTPTPTATPTPKPTPTPTLRPTPTDTGNVAGAATESAAPSPFDSLDKPTPPSKAVPWMILGGSVLVAAAVIPFGIKMLKSEE